MKEWVEGEYAYFGTLHRAYSGSGLAFRTSTLRNRHLGGRTARLAQTEVGDEAIVATSFPLFHCHPQCSTPPCTIPPQRISTRLAAQGSAVVFCSVGLVNVLYLYLKTYCSPYLTTLENNVESCGMFIVRGWK